ncbi:MAG: molybdenum cofactor biosynthesis protein MoaE [Candidatus Latescibacterota bacterium]|nr:molybdenum cofactor biosynthesis protein MoaE [Candidatus Latescibacterota bacterium]
MEVFRVVTEPIRPDALADIVADVTDGAVVTFCGVVRNHSGDNATAYLEYEAYPEMAEKVLADLGKEAQSRWPIGKVSVLHRTGRLEIGETAVLIAVASPHRKEAFEACSYLMDRIKEAVPIWKKEIGANGEYWVEGPEPARGTAPA